jgi:O-antigen/teichoic acid export membrane protein
MRPVTAPPDPPLADSRHSIARGAGVNILGTIGKTLTPVFFILVTRLYGPHDMGVFYLSFVLLDGLIASLTVSGFNDGVLIYAAPWADKPEREEEFYRVLANGLVVTLLISGALLAFVHLGGLPLILALYKQPEIADSVRFMSWAMPFVCIPIIVVAATKSLLIMKWDALVYGFFKPALLIAATVGFRLSDAGLPGLWRGYVLTHVVLTAIALYIFQRHFSFRKLLHQVRRFRYLPALVRFAIPQNLNMTFNSFINNLDVMMLSYFGVSPERIAFYGMGAQIVINLRQVRLVFSGAYAPVISRLWAERNRDEMNRSFSMVFRWTTTFAFPVALLILVFRQDLLRIFHGSFTGDTTFMILLLIPALLNCSIGLAGNLMAMTGHSLWNLANSLAIAGTSVLLNALLIPRYGIMGAAGSSALAGALIYFLVLLEARLVLGTSLIWRRIYKPLLAAAPALVITGVFASQGLATSLGLRAVLALLNTLSFAAALAALKLEPGDREALFPWFKPGR